MIKRGFDDNLHCAGCGDPHGLHHGKIEIFSRIEDEEFVTLTTINDPGVIWEGKGHNPDRHLVTVTRDDGKDNPSARRHGMIIHFWCELCPAETRITIAQNKGITVLQYRKHPRR